MAGMYHCPDCSKIFKRPLSLQQDQITRQSDKYISKPNPDSLNIILDLTSSSYRSECGQIQPASATDSKAYYYSLVINHGKIEMACRDCFQEVYRSLYMAIHLRRFQNADRKDLMKIRRDSERSECSRHACAWAVGTRLGNANHLEMQMSIGQSGQHGHKGS